MGFAPGRGRAAPSDDLPGWVSCWLWAGPFTLGAVWPPRFLPPLPLHPLSRVCQASRVGRSTPGTVSSLSLGLALCGAVAGQGSFSPVPGTILPISNATAQLRVPWKGTRSLQDLSSSFSRSHSVWSCVHSCIFLFGTVRIGLRMASVRSEGGIDFPVTKFPCMRVPAPCIDNGKSWDMYVASSPNLFSS